MEEHQFEEIRELLESINDKLSDIVINSSSIYNATDICSRLDELIIIMEE